MSSTANFRNLPTGVRPERINVGYRFILAVASGGGRPALLSVLSTASLRAGECGRRDAAAGLLPAGAARVAEGCVADDANGWLFIGEEEVGIWRYGAEPGAPPEERVAVDRVGVGEPEGGHLASNVEGLSIYAPRVGGPDDGFLVASSQGNHTYVVYDRAPPHAYRGTFRVGEAGAVDGVEDTDGLHVVSAPVGPRYPMGLLVVQDGINVAPDARVNQNFKLVSWQDVLDALNLAVPEGPERE